MYAYAHALLDEETITLTNFSSGDKLFAFSEVFMALKVYPVFSQNKCTHFFKNSLIKALHLFILILFILLLAHTKLIC